MAANKVNMKISESRRPMDNLEQHNSHLLHLANQLKKACWFLTRVAKVLEFAWHMIMDNPPSSKPIWDRLYFLSELQFKAKTV